MWVLNLFFIYLTAYLFCKHHSTWNSISEESISRIFLNSSTMFWGWHVITILKVGLVGLKTEKKKKSFSLNFLFPEVSSINSEGVLTIWWLRHWQQANFWEHLLANCSLNFTASLLVCFFPPTQRPTKFYLCSMQISPTMDAVHTTLSSYWQHCESFCF